MSERVLQIVMDHWIKEEIFARKKELRERSRDVCQRILFNRKTILTFEGVMKKLKQGHYESEVQKEALQEMAKTLVFALFHNNETYGFCEGCQKGRVYFLVARNFSRSVIASCHICGKIKNWWENVFEEGEFFGE